MRVMVSRCLPSLIRRCRARQFLNSPLMKHNGFPIAFAHCPSALIRLLLS